LDGVHAVAGGVDEVAALGEHEVGEGFVVGAADATAKLVEVGEAEAFGVFDEEGVAVGNVDAAFDDGGAEEEVEAAVDEGVHDFGELGFAHLSVGDGDAEVGEESSEAVFDVVDGFDAVVEVEDLSAALDFALDGLGDGGFVVGDDVGLDGLAFLGGGFNGG